MCVSQTRKVKKYTISFFEIVSGVFSHSQLKISTCLMAAIFYLNHFFGFFIHSLIFFCIPPRKKAQARREKILFSFRKKKCHWHIFLYFYFWCVCFIYFFRFFSRQRKNVRIFLFFQQEKNCHEMIVLCEI